MEIQEKDTLKRGEFLRSLGPSTSALMAFYCLGTTMSSCKSDDNTPTPVIPGTGVTGTASGSDFNIDLTSEKYKKLKTDGASEPIGDILVIATANNNYVALSKACTHQGTSVRYSGNGGVVVCPNHGSQFNFDGSVKKGPAASPLTVFKTTLSGNGNSLNAYGVGRVGFLECKE